ncbi:MAG: hypothetical protein HIU92_09105 [Proteobacteria bacterium]|nr:hypothetical protein [Pseudomonadota bacterium]
MSFVIPLLVCAVLVARFEDMPIMPVGGAMAVPSAAALVGAAAGTPPQAAPPPAPVTAYRDPLKQAVLTDGMRSVRQALNRPGYAAFSGSFVNEAASNVVTLCGEVAGTSGYNSASGRQRFVSVFGQAAATSLEGTDPSFQVLWNRVCARGQTSL